MNPQNPGAPQVPAAAPTSDAAALSQMINSLPNAPQQPNLDFAQPPAEPWAAPAPQQQPYQYPQAPTPPAPTAPIQPQYAPPAPYPGPTPPGTAPGGVTPGQPAPAPAPAPQPGAYLPGAPMQPAPQPGQPQQPPDVIPLPITAPAPQNDTPPAWAQGIINDINQLKNATPPAGQQPQDWNPNGWQDVDARIEQRAKELVQAGLNEYQAQTQAQGEQAENARRQADSFIDQQITQLTTTGYLPQIGNPADPNDAGRAAQKELFAYALSLGTDNLLNVAPALHTMHQSGYYFDREAGQINPATGQPTGGFVRRGSQSAAAQAPIAGSAPGVVPSSVAAPTMAELATMDMSQLAERASNAIPLQ